MNFYHPRTAAIIERVVLRPLDYFSREQIWWSLISCYVAAFVLFGAAAWAVLR